MVKANDSKSFDVSRAGSSPVNVETHTNLVAQWIAYQTSNLGVAGSSPVEIRGAYGPMDKARDYGSRDSGFESL